MTNPGVSPFAAFLGPEPDWRTFDVTAVDGTRLVVRAMGQGHPLMIVHGGMSCAQFFQNVAATLAADHTIYILERRNYSVSANGPRPNSYDIEASDVHRVIDTIGGPCNLFGHSAGGLISLRALATEGAARIRRCALYEPAIDSGGAFAMPILTAYRQNLQADDWRSALRTVLIDITGSTTMEADAMLQMFAALAPSALSRLLTAIEAELEALVAFRMPDVSTLRLPILLIGGEKSAERPLKTGTAKLRALLPHSDYVELAGEGHTANMSSPSVLAAALGAWLS